MSDYIKREVAIEAMENRFADIMRTHKRRVTIGEKAIASDMIETAKMVKSADVASVRHAHWVLLAPIYNSDGLPTFPVKCSRKECGEIAWRRTDYCPFCGAKMDLED